MHVINARNKLENDPIPLMEIVSKFEEDSVSKVAIKYSIRALIKKGYLRKSVVRSKGVCYIQLRGMNL
jgi:hypothetical protein